MLHNSIKITEPLRGKHLMVAMNNRLTKHEILVALVPFTADIFVFTYPVYLVVLYLWGINKRKTYFKEAALYIFFSAASAALVNMVIQFFGDKSRPEEMIALKDNLIMTHLPTDPFPSDHAAVSAAIAMSTMLRGYKHKDPAFMKLSIFFWIACGVMSVSRVAVAIHRPTDILAGIVVGVMVSCILLSSRVRKWLKRVIIVPLVQLEKRLSKTLFHLDQ